MLSSLKDWGQKLYIALRARKREGKLSFFHVIVILTSKKGLKKILSIALKLVALILHKLLGYNFSEKLDYYRFRKKHFPSNIQLRSMQESQSAFNFRPKIIVIMPVYDATSGFLKQAIDSALNQVYENWELHIINDQRNSSDTNEIIRSYSELDDRVKAVFKSASEHSLSFSKSPLVFPTGDFVTFLYQNDVLRLDAFYQVVKHLQTHPSCDMIYSDEDQIDGKGRHSKPYCKPDWSPETFYSRNYIGKLVVIKKALVESVGGLRHEFEDAEGYDLLLRVIEKTREIHHLPMILYHSRSGHKYTSSNWKHKSYSAEATIKVLEDSLIRRNIKGTVVSIGDGSGDCLIRYDISDFTKVSIIIPTRNKHDYCETLLNSIFELTTWPDFEIILIDNNSDDESFFDWVEKWKKREPVRFLYIREESVFNFSRLMNLAAAKASGKYLLLLNNDTEIIDGSWINRMVEFCQQTEIGAVGVKLLYQNNTVQHAGVVIGYCGVAGHTFVGQDRFSTGYFGMLNRVNNYSAVTAACLMVKKTHFELVNGFEEELAIEFNDVDFCLKLLSKGLRNVYVSDVELYHYESISRGHPHKTLKSYQQHIAELRFFQKKWNNYILRDPYYNPNLSTQGELYTIKRRFD